MHRPMSLFVHAVSVTQPQDANQLHAYKLTLPTESIAHKSKAEYPRVVCVSVISHVYMTLTFTNDLDTRL